MSITKLKKGKTKFDRGNEAESIKSFEAVVDPDSSVTLTTFFPMLSFLRYVMATVLA